jgi:hypothetical protein
MHVSIKTWESKEVWVRVLVLVLVIGIVLVLVLAGLMFY